MCPLCSNKPLALFAFQTHTLISSRPPRCALLPLPLLQEQALDIRTALEASLSTPGRVRAVVAVAGAAAIQALLGWCLEGVQPSVRPSGPAGPAGSTSQGGGQGQPQQLGGIGAGFRIDEGSITILNFASEGATVLSRGVVLCSNFAPGGPGRASA